MNPEWQDTIDFHNGNWTNISMDYNITLDFIEHFEEELDWEMLCRFQKKLPEALIEKHSLEVDWNEVMENLDLSMEFIERHIDDACWESISYNRGLTAEFIDKYSDKIIWSEISYIVDYPEHFIEKYADRLNWNALCNYQDLRESFIEKHLDIIDSNTWASISHHQKLSEPFIDKYWEKLALYTIVKHQKISIKLVRLLDLRQTSRTVGFRSGANLIQVYYVYNVHLDDLERIKGMRDHKLIASEEDDESHIIDTQERNEAKQRHLDYQADLSDLEKLI
jgi:hypothetical protein